MFDAPIVELKEYADYGLSGLNRGVRALSTVDKDTMVAEYLGNFIPLQNQHLSGDDFYSMDFDGPPNNRGRFGPRTSILASGLQGGWSRFMNDSTPDPSDVNFYPKVIGGKQRIVVETEKRVPFGNEIRTYYGPNYFRPEDGTAARQKMESDRARGESRESIRHRLRSVAMGTPYPAPEPKKDGGGGAGAAGAGVMRTKRGKK